MANGDIYVISLEDIQQPTYVSKIKVTRGLELQYKNGYLFICDYKEGIIIVDVTSPINPKRVYASPSA